jgi:hypothetical protein
MYSFRHSLQSLKMILTTRFGQSSAHRIGDFPKNDLAGKKDLNFYVVPSRHSLKLMIARQRQGLVETFRCSTGLSYALPKQNGWI